MDNDLSRYRIERKRAADRFYRAKQAGKVDSDLSFAELYPYVKNPDWADIAEMADVSFERKSPVRSEPQYAPDDEVAPFDIINEVLIRIERIIYRIENTQFGGKHNGWIKLSHSGSPAVYMGNQLDEDKFDLVADLRNYVDDRTQTPDQAENLANYLESHESEINNALSELFEVRYLDHYADSLARLKRALFGASLTPEQMRNTSDISDQNRDIATDVYERETQYLEDEEEYDEY